MFFLRELKANRVFSGGRVNSYNAVHLLLSHTTLDAHGNSLSDFTCVRSTDVVSYNSVLIHLVDNHFDVAYTVTIGSHLVDIPF
jgi:hypothetical protein